MNTQEVSAEIPQLPYQKLCDDGAAPLRLLLLCGDNTAVAVGRSPETEHWVSNWIKPFFHIWVGVEEGEDKQRAQVGDLCTDYWWLLATGTDWQQEMCFFFFFYVDRCQSCTCTAAFIKHYSGEKEEEVRMVFTLRVPAAGTHAIVVKNSRK